MTQPQQPQVRVDRDTFVENLRRSGLIDSATLDEALTRIPETDRGKVVARALVEQGLLTKFQAERILVGKTDGFIMGQYRILDELGRGGMGRVYKAEHMTMGRTVALKILSSNLVKTERARQLFEREVRAAAKLNHPNIVTAYDANHMGDRSYLVMEFVDGRNLQDLVTEHGPLPVEQACDYIRQAAQGLQFAHDLGMVHRDIKPANFLVQRGTNQPGSATDIVKILDFGLARLSSGQSDGTPGEDSIEVPQQTVMGTPDFLSPEQARSLNAVDARSDLYSLGCAFFYLLTAQPVFPGGTTLEKLVRHSTEAPRPVDRLRPEVPKAVAAIVMKLLAKKPDDRFPSATALIDALNALIPAPVAVKIPAIAPPIPPPLPPASSEIPYKTKHVPQQNDPWRGIDDEEDNAPPATLPGFEGRTDLEDRIPTNRRRQTKKPKHTPLTMLLTGLIILTVAAGVSLALWLVWQRVK